MHNNGPNTQSENKCDTNSDKRFQGRNFTVSNHKRSTADVYSYGKFIKPVKNVHIVSSSMAYDNPVTGTTTIFIMNKGLYYVGKLYHSLINPNQVINNGNVFW